MDSFSGKFSILLFISICEQNDDFQRLFCFEIVNNNSVKFRFRERNDIPYLTKTCQNRITYSQLSKRDKISKINVHGTTEIGKYHLSYSIKAPLVSLSNNASKIRDINLLEITDIRRRSKWREITAYKREEKKETRFQHRCGSLTLGEECAPSSLSTEIRPEETDEFSTVHRFLA